MKIRILILTLFISKLCLGQDTATVLSQEPIPKESENCNNLDSLDGEKVFTIVEKQPEFPGGDLALIKFLKKNLLTYKITKPKINTAGELKFNL